MKDRENISMQLTSVITSLKKIEENAAIFSELGQISSELAALQEYIDQGLHRIDSQFNSFTQSIDLLSDLLAFQKEVIHCKSAEKTIQNIFQFLQDKLQYEHGFVVYKLKEDNAQYEIYSSDRSHLPQILKFVESSDIDFLKANFNGEVLSQLILNSATYHPDRLAWSNLKINSAIIFPLKARGNVFGLGFLLREKTAFEMQDVSLVNLVLGLISLLMYQTFYFSVLKSRLVEQSKFLKSGDELQISKLFEKGPLYIFTLDSRQIILHANSAAVEDLGESEESIFGEEFLEIISPTERPAARKTFLRIGEKPLQIFRSAVVKRNGRPEIVEFIVSPIKIKSQKDLTLVIGANVTENYYKERITHRNEILDEIDQFSRILVSQFNNLMATIIPNINLLKDSISQNNSNYQKLDHIEKAVHRSANLMRKLLNDDVEGLDVKEEANMNKILNSYVSAKKKEFPQNIRIKLELDPNIKNTTLYPVKIRRLLDIVVGNSIIALQGRIRPEIQFSTSFLSQNKDGMLGDKPYYLKAGQYIGLCIRDNGLGIPEKALHQVLKPFYSTRIKNEGVGLELFLAYNLVKDMKGHIFIESQVDRFTAVYIFLPLKEEKIVISPVPRIEKPQAKSQVRKATVLVVDDEYNIRSMMKEIMEMSGLKVFTAGNGQDGVDIYQQYKKDIDLIIMDMVMPVMDGRAAFNEIRKINPKQKIFIISGYSQREDLQDMLDNGAVGFLRKPFQVKEIVEKVHQIIGSKN